MGDGITDARSQMLESPDTRYGTVIGGQVADELKRPGAFAVKYPDASAMGLDALHYSLAEAVHILLLMIDSDLVRTLGPETTRVAKQEARALVTQVLHETNPLRRK